MVLIYGIRLLLFWLIIDVDQLFQNFYFFLLLLAKSYCILYFLHLFALGLDDSRFDCFFYSFYQFTLFVFWRASSNIYHSIHNVFVSAYCCCCCCLFFFSFLGNWSGIHLFKRKHDWIWTIQQWFRILFAFIHKMNCYTTPEAYSKKHLNINSR